MLLALVMRSASVPVSVPTPLSAVASPWVASAGSVAALSVVVPSVVPDVCAASVVVELPGAVVDVGPDVSPPAVSSVVTAGPQAVRQRAIAPEAMAMALIPREGVVSKPCIWSR